MSLIRFLRLAPLAYMDIRYERVHHSYRMAI